MLGAPRVMFLSFIVFLQYVTVRPTYDVTVWERRLSSNLVASFDDVERLRPLAQIKTLYLEHNPVSKDFEYRKRLAATLPSLTQVSSPPPPPTRPTLNPHLTPRSPPLTQIDAMRCRR